MEKNRQPKESGANLYKFIGLNDVALFDIVVVFETNTALVTLLHFLDVVLEPAQRLGLAGIGSGFTMSSISL